MVVLRKSRSTKKAFAKRCGCNIAPLTWLFLEERSLVRSNNFSGRRLVVGSDGCIGRSLF
ncbi:hypothetical protein [Okeania sp. SIO3I5]|uniref:hypothetical protein n=1 Tax=Okeania sp. SIO3I5 TaxID=2607805 RepID=UPI0025F26371|nr:hypothetical protein [Okeania sp. SIO3I5]